MIKMKHLGAAAEHRAVVWLLDQGYEVFRNVSWHGPIDLVAIKDNQILKLDVKSVKGSSVAANAAQLLAGVKFLVANGDSEFRIVEPSNAAARDLKRTGKPRQRLPKLVGDPRVTVATPFYPTPRPRRYNGKL